MISPSEFGIVQMAGDMLNKEEYFLVDCIKPKSSIATTFNQLRVHICFNLKSKSDLNKIPCASIRLNILRAYYQCRLWHKANVGDTAVS